MNHQLRSLRTGIVTIIAAAVLAASCGQRVQTPPFPEEVQPMSTTHRHFFASPLGALHYIDVGSSDGSPLVLMHQTPRSVDEYRDVIPLLAAEHRVVAVDTPGYGCSDVPDHQPSVEEYADAILALLDHLQVQRAVLVGHHTGAILAIDLAARHPERVERLVLSGPLYMDGEMRDTLHRTSVQWRVRPDGSHMQEKWDKLARWVEDPAVRQRAVTDLLRAGETSEYGHWACADYRMEDTLPLLRGPALILVGSNDPFATDPKNAVLAETIPNAETRVLEGGVFLPSESPDVFAAAVLEYLRGGDIRSARDPASGEPPSHQRGER